MKKNLRSRLDEYASQMQSDELVVESSSPVDDADENKGVFGDALGLLLVTIFLTAFGLMMIYSATSHFSGKETAAFFRNQFIWAIIGCVSGTVAFFMGHKLLGKLSYWLLGGTALLLLWARCSREVNGAHRWIHLAGYTFQPSEMAKIAVAIFIAWYCSENLRTFDRLKRKRNGLLQLGGIVGFMLGLILIGEDYGTTALVGIMSFVTVFVAGLSWFYWLVPIGLGGLMFLYIKAFDAMRWGRLTIFLEPEHHQNDYGMQLWFSLLALGSGSWFGVGLTKSRFKADYLPEKQTDFILSIVGEELGFAGIAAVLVLYTLWGFFALRIALKSRDRCGMLLGWALTVGVMLQAAINFGAMSGCFPTKGMPAPFISYGGSNLLGCLIATGILLSIAAYTENPGYRDIFRRGNENNMDGDF